jgi:uncharacterized protein (DUF362 family)
MNDILPILEELASLAHPDGGWGYAPGQVPHPEPTCFGILALNQLPERFAGPIESAQTVLREQASPDGAYRRNGDREEVIWPTALVLFVQAVTGQPRSVVEATAACLLSVKGRDPNDKQAAEIHDFNVKIDGWPWAIGNFSWVEPTAWACVALRKAGLGGHPRVGQGQDLLLDRAFDDGGINYGNRFVLGRRTEPIPAPTALMLLALQGRSDEPRVCAAIDYLSQRALLGEDLQHLCWAKVALNCFRDRVADGLDERLNARIFAAYRARTADPWPNSSPILAALAALALSADRFNPFWLQSPASPSENTKAAKTSGGGVMPGVRKKPWSERIAARFRGLAVEALGHLRPVPASAVVHIAKASDYNEDLVSIFLRQYENFRDCVPLAGKRVVLKPNIVEYHRDKVINTHPHVIAAAIELCKREGAAEVIVAEGPGHWRNVEYLVRECGLGAVLREYGTKFTDLNHDEPVRTANLGRLTGLDYLYISRTVIDADVLISLPKLKTHHWAGVTLSLKNLFGTLPGICYGWPKNELHWRGIDNSIVDIALTRPPDLQIVDGILGMEGDGPLNGTAKQLGALVMGTDPVAVDATCCRLMNIDPECIKYLVLGYQKRLGFLKPAEIQQIGETPGSIVQSFDPAPHFQPIQLGRTA